MLTKTYTPKLQSIKAQSLYGKLLDFLLWSADPAYNDIVRFRKDIDKLEIEQDKEELKQYFESEFNKYQSMAEGAWEYYKKYDY